MATSFLSALASLLPCFALRPLLLNGFAADLLNGSELLQLEFFIFVDELKFIRLRFCICFRCLLLTEFGLTVLIVEVILLRLQLRNLLDLAFQCHVGLLQVLDVLMLHLVHVDHLQNLRVVG